MTMASTVERAHAEIRRGILAGEFGPGARLKEEELASRVGVSRTPVREALRRLNAEGLVDFVPNQGAFVASWSDHELDDIFRLRSLLEGHAAELAARSATPVQITELERLARHMIELEANRPGQAMEAIAEANAAFHRLILEAAGSRRLTAMMAHVVEIPLVLRTFGRYSPEALARSLRHHVELAAAVRARDPLWAGSVMRSHIMAAWHAIQQNVEDQRAGGAADAAD
ncbi:MAG TPA: GntR family transcriptional regulator [Azospirillaceae bacterium]|nr:GntR family transcriptional regulator [Azospirillaceae bacterium]